MSGNLAQTEIRNTTASGDSDSRESARNSEDPTSKSGSGRPLGKGNGNPLQYSCLERNLAGYSPWSRQELDRTEQLNKHTVYKYPVWIMLSSVQLFATPMICKAPLTMEFSRQEYWSGLPFLTPGDLPDQGWNLLLICFQADFLPLRYLGFPYN